MWGHLQWLHPVKSNQGNPTRNVVVGCEELPRTQPCALTCCLLYCRETRNVCCGVHFVMVIFPLERYALMFIIALLLFMISGISAMHLLGSVGLAAL